MNKPYALIILGAGCAGLSVATRLATSHKACPNTLVLEQRSTFSHDRTWCFWQHPAYEASALIRQSWTQFSVRNKAQQVTRDCRTTPYVCIAGIDFYQHAQDVLASTRQAIQLQMNTAVFAVQQQTDGLWCVRTNQGDYFASHIIDTRPQQASESPTALLWQSFFGIELQTKDAAFDPKAITLMDIDTTFRDGLGFLYVLPSAQDRALLEYTVFSSTRYDAHSLSSLLQATIQRSHPSATVATTLRTEYGALPMGHLNPQRSLDDSYVYAGLFAGGARPSSGYSFLRIQRWATACAEHLVHHGKPLSMQPDPRWLRWMDQVFLQVLLRFPQHAGDLFFRFFSRPSVDAIANFMNDTPTLAQVRQIICAMPAQLFLRALWRSKRNSGGGA